MLVLLFILGCTDAANSNDSPPHPPYPSCSEYPLVFSGWGMYAGTTAESVVVGGDTIGFRGDLLNGNRYCLTVDTADVRASFTVSDSALVRYVESVEDVDPCEQGVDWQYSFTSAVGLWRVDGSSPYSARIELSDTQNLNGDPMSGPELICLDHES